MLHRLLDPVGASGRLVSSVSLWRVLSRGQSATVWDGPVLQEADSADCHRHLLPRSPGVIRRMGERQRALDAYRSHVIYCRERPVEGVKGKFF